MALSIDINDKGDRIRVPIRSTSNSTRRSNYQYRATSRSVVVGSEQNKTISRRKKFVLLGGILLLLFSVVSFGLERFASEMGLKISAGTIFNQVTQESTLRKDSSGIYTNVMLVGIDTRETNMGLQNTDTIIFASYNHVSGETVLFSVPRDTYTGIPGQNWYVKINAIYNRAEQSAKGTGLEALKLSLEDYMGQEIQYYAMVDIKALENIVDILGGVEIYVENTFIDYAYPNESNPNVDYITVRFERGPQTMDGDSAVKYVRSRKSLMNGEGSDFARARRQQNLVVAIKDKALSTETLLNPKKLLEIVAELQKNIRISEFTNQDIEAGLRLLRENGTEPTYSFVLDPNVANGKILSEGNVPEAYAVSPNLGLGKYEDLHSFINTALEDPEMYHLDPMITVYNVGIGAQNANDIVGMLQDKYPFTRIIFGGTLFTDRTGTYIYNNSDDLSFDLAVNRFRKEVKPNPMQSKPEYIESRLNGGDVIILLGGLESDSTATQQ